jgi:hypothetical protein
MNKWRVRKKGEKKTGSFFLRPFFVTRHLFKNPQNLQQKKATATQASRKRAQTNGWLFQYRHKSSYYVAVQNVGIKSS